MTSGSWFGDVVREAPAPRMVAQPDVDVIAFGFLRVFGVTELPVCRGEIARSGDARTEWNPFDRPRVVRNGFRDGLFPRDWRRSVTMQTRVGGDQRGIA